MADLIVPRLGESITEAVVAKWLKRVGEPVKQDEPVVDLETDKVSVSLPAPSAGVLAEQRALEGATVQVGEVIGAVSAGAPERASSSAAPAPSTATPTATREPAAPSSLAPTRAAATPPPPVAPPAIPAPPVAPRPISAPPAVASPPVVDHLSPSQRRALRERTTGTPAPSGDGHAARPAAPAGEPAPIPPATPVAPADGEEVVAMTPLRRRIAERLVEAQHSAAILTTFNEVDMTRVMDLRARYQESFTAKHGVKLGLMSFFARAVVEALKDFPGLNAEVRGASIVYKKHYDLGIAVGGGRGLVVPVVRGVDRLSMADIERAVADLGARARDNRLTLEDLSGGTFTITNGGVYGSMLSTPLLNLPQTGILGMHNIVRRPVAVTGAGGLEEIAIRPMMYLALSYDHRVVDGREAVQFLVGVKGRIESPERLMFGI